MKKILWSSALVALLLSGCADSEEADEVTTPDVEETTEMPEEETEEKAAENEDEPESTLIGALTDTSVIPLQEYDESKWEYRDTSHLGEFLENELFVEEDALYIATADNSARRLDREFNPVWVNEVSYGYQTKIALDEQYLYNPSLGNQESAGNAVKVVNKESGETIYEIDTIEYAEISEFLIDDEALYMVFGKIEDPDEELFADRHSLHKFDKNTGEEIWHFEIEGTRLSGVRPHHYELTQNDDLIFIVEEDGEDLVLLARNKEDGEIAWSETFPEDVEQIRHGKTHLHGDSLSVIDRGYVVHTYNQETGEKEAEYQFEGEVYGAMTPQPVFYEDLLLWQDVSEDYHHMKAADVVAEEELWTLDLDGHFLVDYAMVDDILYVFFGTAEKDSEDNTLMARMDPKTGEVFNLVDLGESISANYNNYYRSMGLTEHQGNLAYFYQNHLYIFNE